MNQLILGDNLEILKNIDSEIVDLIYLDKTGEQSWKFKPGIHNVAVKVVDNDGLENVEVVKLKVNGGGGKKLKR